MGCYTGADPITDHTILGSVAEVGELREKSRKKNKENFGFILPHRQDAVQPSLSGSRSQPDLVLGCFSP